MTTAISEALPVLKVAIVGHTNTGKTSLVRTLIRDVGFGEVSDRPATTRHVEGAVLMVSGKPLVELFDTPGLEDPIGLLDYLEDLRADRRTDWIDVIRRFVDDPALAGRFEQEAKALRQVLASDAALYVIDVRDRVLGKHRDELEILGRCARPVIPVLNFVAKPDARTAEWREHLSRVSMHAVAEFDTVVLHQWGEQRLFEKMRTLLDRFAPTLDALIADRQHQRTEVIRSSAELLADMLLDAAAFRVRVAERDPDRQAAALARLQQEVRVRERACVRALLTLFRFRDDDVEADEVPVENGQWGLDLFNPASLKQFGIRAGGGAAAGGLAGLAVDAMTGGLSLGVAAAMGAALGAVWGSFGSHGERIAASLRGYTELRLSEATVKLLVIRQLALIQALLRRGHAAQDKLRLEEQARSSRAGWAARPLPEPLREARVHPEWSRLGGGSLFEIEANLNREAAKAHLANILSAELSRSSPDPQSPRTISGT